VTHPDSPSDDTFCAEVARFILRGDLRKPAAWSPSGVRALIVGLAQQRNIPVDRHYTHAQAVARNISKRVEKTPELRSAYAEGQLPCTAAVIVYARQLTEARKKPTEHRAGQNRRSDIAGLRLGEGQPRARQEPPPVRKQVTDTSTHGDHRGPRSRL
jgi:hypothetical protein